MSTETDLKLAGLAAGFTLGFGVLTVWEAAKQTRTVTSPLRSHYIWMVWGEIVSNVAIAIIAWLLLSGVVVPTVPVLVMILFCWVWEIQLLMQIIINRTTVIVDDHQLMIRIKWGTAILLCCIQITVFCIWIPTHSIYSNPTYAQINKYWDPTSKVMILLIDAALNIYFIRSVKKRLVKYHGLKKYAALVTFNTRLMVVSICMDIMIIGLMNLQNGMVYTQFHPVAYMVKLNIEMTMASLIRKIAKATISEREGRSMGRYNEFTSNNITHPEPTFLDGSLTTTSTKVRKPSSFTSNEIDRICETKEAQVRVENVSVSDGDKDGQISVYSEIDRKLHERRGIMKLPSNDELSIAV